MRECVSSIAYIHSIDSEKNIHGVSGFARLINHSRRNPNLMAKKIVDTRGFPHIVLYALRDICQGEELCFDYGDRRKEVLTRFPWLAD